MGQGNIFTSVCQEFCPQGGRVSASVHAGIHPLGADTPHQTPPPQTRPPGSRHPPDQTPREQTCPRTRPPQTRPPGADTPWTRHPLDQTPPPPQQTVPYSLRVASMHPTGMHSCYICASRTARWKKRTPLSGEGLCPGVSVQGGSLSGGALSKGCCCLGGSPWQRPPAPCEQNHRRLWKHYLAATSLRAVVTQEYGKIRNTAPQGIRSISGLEAKHFF